MSNTASPLEDRESSLSAIAWNFFLLFSLEVWPRVVIVAFWIFSDLLGDAFGPAIIPIVGFFVLPWTTMAYAFMWSISSDRVYGLEWLGVVIGVALDLWAYAVLRRIVRAQRG
jgi:hypothetical protein